MKWLLPAAALASLPVGATGLVKVWSAPHFVPYGWKRATVNGTVAVAANNAPLPEGFMNTVNGDGSVTSSLTASARMYMDVPMRERAGAMTLGYKVKFATLPTGGLGSYECIAEFTDVQSGYATTVLSASNTTAYASGLHDTVSARANIAWPTPDDERSAGPKNKFIRVRQNVSPAQEADGRWSVLIDVSLQGFFAKGKVTGPHGASNMTIAAASGIGVSEVFPKSAKLRPSSGGVIITGSPLRLHTDFHIVRSDGVFENPTSCVRNDQGEIDLTPLDIPNQSVTLRLVEPGFLRQSIVRSVVDEEYDATPAFEQVFGDANRDGVVNAADVALIQSYVGTVKDTEAWWDDVPGITPPNMGPLRVQHLDENQDGQITSVDVAAAQANLGRTAT